jgi:hypothetical protein
MLCLRGHRTETETETETGLLTARWLHSKFLLVTVHNLLVDAEMLASDVQLDHALALLVMLKSKRIERRG